VDNLPSSSSANASTSSSPSGRVRRSPYSVPSGRDEAATVKGLAEKLSEVKFGFAFCGRGTICPNTRLHAHYYLQKTRALAKLQDLMRRTQAALKQSVKEGREAKEQAAQLQAMLDNVHANRAGSDRRTDKRLAEAQATIDNLTAQLRALAGQRRTADGNADRIADLEREVRSLKSELKKRSTRCSQLNAELTEIRAKTERELAQAR